MAKVLILFIILFSNVVFSEENNSNTFKKLSVSDIENKNSKLNFEKNDTDFTKNDILNIENFINSNDYYSLYDYLKRSKVSKNYYIKFLESKKNKGIIPLYWLMADFYSFDDTKLKETSFWLNVAIITSAQDATICVDKNAKNFIPKMISTFPNSANIVRTNPQLNNEIMPKVKFFIENINERINPLWICELSENYPKFKSSPLILEKNWSNNRMFILNEFMRNYNN